MEKKEKNKRLAILVGTLMLVIGVSFAYFTGVTDTKGNGDIAEGNITVVKGAELNVQGKLEFNDTGILPGHKNVSSIKVTATGNNELVPYNLIWNGTNELNTPLNFTVYKTTTEINVTTSCQKQNKVENGLTYLSEECTISNLDKLGAKIASGRIETSNTKTKVILAEEEFITATQTGAVVYYYIILEYPNLDSDQNIDMGKSFDGIISAEESSANPDISIVATYIKQENGSYKSSADIPQSGYSLNKERSTCSNSATPEWVDNKLKVGGLTKQGTQCELYFDMIKDTSKPVISKVEATEKTKTSITVKVTATDNEGVTKYYYSINNGTYTESTTNTHTFSGLTKGTSYTIKVKARDAAGNESDVSTTTIATENDAASDIILGGITANPGSDSFTGVETGNKGILTGTDNDGTTYYYRGAVTNNYLKFANKWWRIIRINGDGTIRIIYDGTAYHANGSSTTDSQIGTSAFNSSFNDNAYVGFMYGATGQTTYEATHTNTNKSTIMTTLETWYTNNLASYADKIDINAGFCGDRSINTGSETWINWDTKKGFGTNATAYGPFSRILNTSGNWNSTQTPTFKCPNSNDLYTVSGASKGNKAMEKPIGLITADEVIYAGGFGGTSNNKYYLYNGQYYWTMSPSDFGGGLARVFYVASNGSLGWGSVHNAFGVRPVINLKSDVTITGSGTQNDPYVVS